MTFDNQPAQGQQAAAGQPAFIEPAASAPAALGQAAEITAQPATSPSQPSSKSGNGLRLGLVGALVAVTGLGGFAVKTAVTQPAGPQSPEEAMETFFVALDNEDLIGMAETLLPSERESLIDPSLALVEEVERLEIFGAGIEIDTLGTLEVVVAGVVAQAEPLADGFAFVSSNTGTIAVTGGSDDLPVVAAIFDLTNQDPEPATTETINLADDPFEMVAVEHDGTWYLSLAYTAAEAIRSETTRPLPIFGGGPVPVGGESPEAAIENLMNELVQGDLEGALTQLDPEEMRALYDYSPLFVPDAQELVDRGLAELRAEGADWAMTNIALHSVERNGRTIVLLDALDIELSMPGTQASASFANGCTTIEASGEAFGEVNETVCQGESPSGAELDFMAELGLGDIEIPEFGTTVVERDGRWYVSTIPTALYSWIDVLQVLEPADIEAIKNNAFDLPEELISSLIMGSSMIGTTPPAKFESVGEAIDGPAFGEPTTDGPTFNFVEVDPSYIPEGFDSFPMDTQTWWPMSEYDLAEPVGLFAINTSDYSASVSVAEFPSAEAAQGEMAKLLAYGFEGDLDSASDFFSTIRRSGRFLVFEGFEEEGAQITLVEQMVIHLANQ